MTPSTRRLGIVLLLAVAVAGVAAYFIASNRELPAAPALAPPPVAPSAAPHPTAAPAVTPPAQPESVAKSVFIPAPKKVDQRFSIVNEFRNAKSMKAFYDKYSSPIYANDGAAAFYRAEALKKCAGWAKFPVEKMAPSMIASDWNTSADPTTQQRVQAMSAQVQQCAGLIDAGDEKLIQSLVDQAIQLNDPAATAASLADLARSGKKEEAESIARQLLQNPNADLVQGLVTYFAKREDPWPFGDIDVSKPGMRGDAWRLAACAWGADCGPSNNDIRTGCVMSGSCRAATYQDYLQRYRYTPADFERLQQAANHITSSVAAQNWAAIGLTQRSTGNGK